MFRGSVEYSRLRRGRCFLYIHTLYAAAIGEDLVFYLHQLEVFYVDDRETVLSTRYIVLLSPSRPC